MQITCQCYYQYTSVYNMQMMKFFLIDLILLEVNKNYNSLSSDGRSIGLGLMQNKLWIIACTVDRIVDD